MPRAVAILNLCACLTLLVGVGGALLLGFSETIDLTVVYLASLLFLSLITAVFLYGFAANLTLLQKILERLPDKGSRADNA